MTPDEFQVRVDCLRLLSNNPRLDDVAPEPGDLIVYVRDSINLYLWNRSDGEPLYTPEIVEHRSDGTISVTGKKPNFGEYLYGEVLCFVIIGIGPKTRSSYSWLNVVSLDGLQKGYIRESNLPRIRIVFRPK